MRPQDVAITPSDGAREPLLASSEASAAAKAASDIYWTKTCCFGVMTLVSMSYQFSEAPLLQLYENAICREFHTPGGRPKMFAEENRCETNSIRVQKELASITAIQVNLDTIIALVASVYMPSLLRTWGIRRMLQLNLIFHMAGQLWIYLMLGYRIFPVKLTWASSVTLAIASGPYMRLEMIFMILALVTPEDDRFETFTLGQMVVLVPDFLAKQSAAFLMERGIWLPLALGIACLTLAIVALFWNMPTEPAGEQTTGSALKPANIRTQFVLTVQVLLLSPAIFFLIMTFSFTNVFGQLMSGSTLLQVLKRKFGMSLGDASVIQSFSNLVSLPPLAVMYFFLRGWDTLHVCCVCAACMMIGLLLIGVAQSWIFVIAGFIFCATGQGFRMAARSELSLTKNVPKEDLPRLYILIFYMDMVGGGLFNAWVLAHAFNEGLDDGGMSLGLPLFVAVAEWFIVALIAISIQFLRNRPS
ncbi:hypothetical protein BKA65DRAFT_510749 [Rhexocercosporidium sp. MPI-PUGE-AT-0058]|nr:hypothetical protein BKA65DRAFT_510749 [Rhexocercosporidium sp. MPI-PUGE-AT-0058]